MSKYDEVKNRAIDFLVETFPDDQLRVITHMVKFFPEELMEVIDHMYDPNIQLKREVIDVLGPMNHEGRFPGVVRAIKHVRTRNGSSLKDAKEFVDSIRKELGEGWSRYEQ